jgi:hypothetical protein
MVLLCSRSTRDSFVSHFFTTSSLGNRIMAVGSCLVHMWLSLVESKTWVEHNNIESFLGRKWWVVTVIVLVDYTYCTIASMLYVFPMSVERPVKKTSRVNIR